MDDLLPAIRDLTYAIQDIRPLFEKVAAIFEFGVEESKDKEAYAPLKSKLEAIDALAGEQLTARQMIVAQLKASETQKG